MSEPQTDEELARYHVQRGKELWANLEPRNPPSIAVSSIDWHFACAAIYVRLAEVSNHNSVEIRGDDPTSDRRIQT